jgi:hypothetical protein
MSTGIEQLQPIFEAARDFGLDPEEVWEAAKTVASRYPPRTPVSECRDEVIEALAQNRGESRARGLTPLPSPPIQVAMMDTVEGITSA